MGEFGYFQNWIQKTPSGVERRSAKTSHGNDVSVLLHSALKIDEKKLEYEKVGRPFPCF